MKKSLISLLFLAVAQLAFSQTHVFVFLNKRTDKAEVPKEELDKLMNGHMANMSRLAKEGKLLAAGPFEGGGGIFIFNSTSVENVKEWLQTDPGVKAERWRVEVLPYFERLGKVVLASEPIQMTNYQFIRYIPYIAKSNINELPQLFKKHDDYLAEIKKGGQVIADGIFGNTEGGILILRTEISSSVIENDPAIQQGLLQVEIKKLYIAKGAFSEK